MKFAKSLAELVFLTYAVSFLGAITADGFNLLDVTALKAAAAAALPSAAVVVYAAFARLLGNYNSPLVVDTRDDRVFPTHATH